MNKKEANYLCIFERKHVAYMLGGGPPPLRETVGIGSDFPSNQRRVDYLEYAPPPRHLARTFETECFDFTHSHSCRVILYIS